MNRAWCDECQTMRDIESVGEEGALERISSASHRERVWMVADLSCGHQASKPTDRTFYMGVDR